jgi:hypothetical protein
MTALERAVRLAWVGWGYAYAQWAVCPSCHEWSYCRSPSGRRWLCLDCFDQR